MFRRRQEELYEKFAFNIPRHDTSVFRDVNDQIIPIEVENPWGGFDVFIAGRQAALQQVQMRVWGRRSEGQSRQRHKIVFIILIRII